MCREDGLDCGATLFNMLPALTARPFGRLPRGEAVQAWTLSGRGGLVLEIITLGATITRMLVPDKEGHQADVVLGFNDAESYLTNCGYFGATVGRVAGRITGARFKLDDESFELAHNDGTHHLHGGLEGFDRKIWSAIAVERADGAPSVLLEYLSPHGEEGYPGSVRTTVAYTVTDDNGVCIESEATTDRATPVSLTQHSYFNLGGEGSGTFADHELQIRADEFVHMDDELTLLGQLDDVTGRPNDFRQPRNLGEATPLLFQRHGDLYRLRKASRANPEFAARLVHHRSGRALDVLTTTPYLQLYTAVALDGSCIGKSGVPYQPYAGLCLECEGYPDVAGSPELADIILRPGMTRRETTIYRFATT